MDSPEHKRMTFKQVEQGYDPQEVDHYIDLLASHYELLHGRYRQLEADHQRLIATRSQASSPLAGGALLPESDAVMRVDTADAGGVLLEVDEAEAALLAGAAAPEALSGPTFAPLPEHVAGTPFVPTEIDKRGRPIAEAHKKPSLITRLIQVLFYLVLALLILAALSFALSENPDKSFLGYRWYWIESGSMEPVLPIGSLVIVRAVNPAQLRVGDDVTFITGTGNPVEYVTHRIVEITTDEAGFGPVFITKGLANAQNDPERRDASSVVGKVIASVPYIGAGVAWLRDHLLWVGALVLLLFVLYLIFRRMR